MMEDMEKKLAFLLASSPHFMLKGGSSTYRKAAKDFIANGVVVREKGEWVENHMRAIFSCSLCGCEIYDRRIYKWEQYPPENFCPNCGADMRKKN